MPALRCHHFFAIGVLGFVVCKRIRRPTVSVGCPAVRAAPRKGSVAQRSVPGSWRQTRHGKLISTMAQLKNCCLGGSRARLRVRWTAPVAQSFLSSHLPLISLNQLSLSRDIYYPIIIDQINIFTRIFHLITGATVNDSLRARQMC